MVREKIRETFPHSRDHINKLMLNDDKLYQSTEIIVSRFNPVYSGLVHHFADFFTNVSDSASVTLLRRFPRDEEIQNKAFSHEADIPIPRPKAVHVIIQILLPRINIGAYDQMFSLNGKKSIFVWRECKI